MRSLTLMIPTLANSYRKWRASSTPDNIKQDPWHIVPTLSKALARANTNKPIYPDARSGFMQQLSTDWQAPWPFAALSAYAAKLITDKQDPHYWAYATPVVLEADMQTCHLLGQQGLVLDEAQELAILNHLNDFLAEDDLQLVRTKPLQWLFAQKTTPDFYAKPYMELIGEDISQHLLTGEQQDKWRCLQTECQMLLHAHPVNQQRLAQKKAVLNSLWFWGVGQLPHIPLVSPWQQVYTDDDVIGGAASLAGAHVFTDEDFSIQALETLPDALLIWLTAVPSTQTEDDLPERWIGYQTNLLLPLLDALQAGKLQQLILQFSNHKQYILTPRQRRCFWKRCLTLEEVMYA